MNLPWLFIKILEFYMTISDNGCIDKLEVKVKRTKINNKRGTESMPVL